MVNGTVRRLYYRISSLEVASRSLASYSTLESAASVSVAPARCKTLTFGLLIQPMLRMIKINKRQRPGIEPVVPDIRNQLLNHCARTATRQIPICLGFDPHSSLTATAVSNSCYSTIDISPYVRRPAPYPSSKGSLRFSPV